MLCEGQSVEIPVFLKPFKFGRSQTPKYGSLRVLILCFIKIDLEKTLQTGIIFIHKVASFCVQCLKS